MMIGAHTYGETPGTAGIEAQLEHLIPKVSMHTVANQFRLGSKLT